MSNNGPSFITGLKGRMNQLASFFTEQLEKELAKPNIAVEEYKKEVQSLEFRVKNLEQTIENLEKTIKDQNALISQIKDSQTQIGKRATGNPAKPKAKKKPQTVAKSPSKNGNAGQQTLNQFAQFATSTTSPVGLKRNLVPSVAVKSEEPDIKYIKTEPGTATRDESKPMTSTSTSGGTAAHSASSKVTDAAESRSPKIPDQPGQPEASEPRRRMLWTLETKLEAIDEIQKQIGMEFSEPAAIMITSSVKKFDGVGEKRLKSWWDDRDKFRRQLADNPQALNKKAIRKSNPAAATAPSDPSGFDDDDGDSMIANIPEMDIIEIPSSNE